MHEAAYAFVAKAAQQVGDGPVLEIGARNINGSVRPLFGARPFVGIDVADGDAVDAVADGATYQPDVPPETVVCCEVLEHAPNAEAICRNAHAILQPGGWFIVTAAGTGRKPHSGVDGQAVHDGEFYRNVTAEALRGWLSDFAEVDIAENPGPADIYALARKAVIPVQNRTTVRVQPRPLKVLLVHPGATWSTADVEDGLRFGLLHHGIDVIQYRLDVRIARAAQWLELSWRKAVKENPSIPKPTISDKIYQAGIGALEKALRHQVDAVLVVSAMVLHPDVILLMKRAGLKVTVLFTESPYDLEKELTIAAMVDGCWTNERSSVDAFRRVNTHAGYLPHAWHPKKHFPVAVDTSDVPSHDVVFVGSGFTERARFFNAVDWAGIDLGLYGSWDGVGLRKGLLPCVRGKEIDNVTAAALYRRAKIGLNLYRTSKGLSRNAPAIAHAESLNPRAYELAACGVFSISHHRLEVTETFGDRVPTFRTPTEAAVLIRMWLADAAGRSRVAAELPACVAESSWVERAACVIGDLNALLHQQLAASA